MRGLNSTNTVVPYTVFPVTNAVPLHPVWAPLDKTS